MIVHIIFSAHLDPIWLWPWTAGMDEALATFRSACDRLDKHPDMHFSFGEAAIYEQIEKCDPELFCRVRKHIEAGRWEIVGGWWVQPDCNLPSGFALEKQIAMGRAYFESRFGIFPRMGFNVDSFGHAATLPTMMRAAGQDAYVMMRPQENEMHLPSHYFRWQEKEGSPAVTTVRLSGGYGTFAWDQDPRGRIEDALRVAVPEIGHTVCMLGLSNHGGGPTERLIEWCRKNQDAFPGVKLVFSTVAKFLAELDKKVEKLPTIVGELQHHAVGCYSVHRASKLGVRRAEHRLRQCDVVAAELEGDTETKLQLAKGWKNVCFHHFHDTLGGTCLPSAYGVIQDQLGQASAAAEEALHFALRRKLRELPADPLQRVVFWNPSDTAFDGYAEYEIYPGYPPYPKVWRLLDERGEPVAHQALQSEAVIEFGWQIFRPLVKLKIGAGEMRVLRLDWKEHVAASRAKASDDGVLTNDVGVRCDFGAGRIEGANGAGFALPHLALIGDATDTWSHDVDRYGEEFSPAKWEAQRIVDRGPLMVSAVQTGVIGASTLIAEWRVYAGESAVDLILRVVWNEKHQVLKLVLPFNKDTLADSWLSGVPGGVTRRGSIGKEAPVRDFVQAGGVGVLCPDIFAADVTDRRLRMTLLRSCVLAHHVPYDVKARARPGTYADRGEHKFRFRFVLNNDVTHEYLENQAAMFHRPLVVADLTRGMPDMLLPV